MADAEDKPDSLRAHLLVAVPRLMDPNFFRSVTLLVEHGEQGALGLILNRPTSSFIQDVWSEIRGTECHMEGMMHVGGPCQGFLTALHAVHEAGDAEVLPGLYYSQKPESLEQIVAKQRGGAKFFLGFAGWAAGQLEAELEEGSWLILPATVEDVFSDDENLWQQLIQRIVGPGLLDVIAGQHVPDDPAMN